jgi:hypothetical protein
MNQFNRILQWQIQSMDKAGRQQASPAAQFKQLVYRSVQKLIIPLVLGNWHGTPDFDRRSVR